MAHSRLNSVAQKLCTWTNSWLLPAQVILRGWVVCNGNERRKALGRHWDWCCGWAECFLSVGPWSSCGTQACQCGGHIYQPSVWGGDRLCPESGRQWPAQRATPNPVRKFFWLVTCSLWWEIWSTSGFLKKYSVNLMTFICTSLGQNATMSVLSIQQSFCTTFAKIWIMECSGSGEMAYSLKFGYSEECTARILQLL